MNSSLNKFLVVRFFSSLGDQILLFTIPLLVYQSTHSIALSGLAFFIEWLPRVISLPFAGVLSDKFGGRLVYLFADGIRAFVCILTFTLVSIFPLFGFYIISVSMGVCALCYAQAFIAQEATVPSLTKYSELHKAQSMVQSIEQTNIILGPLIASVLTYYIATTELLIVTAVIFCISLSGMLSLKNFSSERRVSHRKTTLLQDMHLGLKIILSNKLLIWLCLMTIIINLIWGLTLATGAAFITGVFSSTNIQYGLIQTATGLCSILALLIAPLIIPRTTLTHVGVTSYFLMLIGGIVIGCSNQLWLFIIGYILIQCMDAVFNVYIRTERAKLIPKEHLGKTTGIIVLINQLSLPLSGLLVANFSNSIGVNALFLIVSAIAFIFLGFLLSQSILIPNRTMTTQHLS